jgi:putative nucleotidyltransferase with HDIG domain
MLLSKRFLHGASRVQNALFAFLLGLLILFVNAKVEFARSSVLTLVLLASLYFSLLYLRAKDVQVSYLAILFSGMTAYLVPNLFSYLSLLYLKSRLKNLAITDPFTGFYSPRDFVLEFNEKLKSKHDLVFVGLRIGNYRQLTLKLDFEQIKTMTRLFGRYLRSQVENHFKTCLFSRLSNDTLAVVIEGAQREEVETSLRSFLRRGTGLDWNLKGDKTSIALKGCLIHISKANMGTSDDVISQMEEVFDQAKEGQMVVEELREAAGENTKTKYENILDFIAYDWEERNRDLEEGLKEILETNKRLDQLNWGALTALARAIDAKSKWTAGHSERVTRLALKIGAVLGLTQEELDDLHRAGLLHDIGKIGTPGEVIDKPASLTEEENRIIGEHPSLGARILEPIRAYAKIIPMVKQHHEWFNGEGYPDGIDREAITLGARILAVADVYDALSSERPYRPAMEPAQVFPMMRENSGTHFDPVVVEAFFKVMDKDMHPKEDRVLD